MVNIIFDEHKEREKRLNKVKFEATNELTEEWVEAKDTEEIFEEAETAKEASQVEKREHKGRKFHDRIYEAVSIFWLSGGMHSGKKGQGQRLYQKSKKSSNREFQSVSQRTHRIYLI